MFVRTIVKDDVHRLHNCLTHDQFLTMSKLVIQAWIEMGEIQLARISMSYTYQINNIIDGR